jgi:hypothetical protein
MILQRGGARVWGEGATPGADVSVSAGSVKTTAVTNTTGHWMATLSLEANVSTTVSASDGHSMAMLLDVAVGDVILCGAPPPTSHTKPATHSQPRSQP